MVLVSTHIFPSLVSVITCGVLALFRDPDSHSVSLSISLLSPGGSESSWDKEKLQSPPSSRAQHGLAHAGLSAQHGLSGSHLSSLQQSHLLANRESFIHHIHSFTRSPAPGVLITLSQIELHVVLVIHSWVSAHSRSDCPFRLFSKSQYSVFMTSKCFSCFFFSFFSNTFYFCNVTFIE